VGKVLRLVSLVLLLSFSLTLVFAAEVPINVTVNYEPNVQTISLTDSDGGTLQVFANDTRVFNCTGTVHDGDGFADISSVNATIFGFGSSAPAADTAGNHYTNTSCVRFAGSGNTTTYTCGFVVYHHTQNGTWTCNVSVNDTFNKRLSNTTTNTVDASKLIQVDNQTLAFGSFARGTDSGTTDVILDFNNSGNTRFNVTIDAYSLTGVPADTNAMLCTTGNLSVGFMRWSLLPGIAATAKTVMTNAPMLLQMNTTTTPFGSTAPVAFSFYMGIVIPPTGLGGRCTGFLDVIAT
jgi:hypothetical protein